MPYTNTKMIKKSFPVVGLRETWPLLTEIQCVFFLILTCDPPNTCRKGLQT